MKNNEIAEKIEIFNKSDFITDLQKQKLLEILSILQMYEEVKTDTFLTHVVMAIKRTNNKENVDKLDQIIIDQFNENKKLVEGDIILLRVLKILDLDFHSNEIDYFRLHILNLLAD